ncbi:hypothetical protein [Chiayiivirga flava]|uniref:Gpi18-like mannosyltransferase n=1 Tax=Chiayiivirga flava TaxID=659595 RepID=A0A7W8G0Z3_9GAMM|nr:hypothetical protein [Chiayiivirga flava]MBB5207140.1 Gpi18-like mannosyltransferase [Chiayiivirga flava]
MVLLVAVVAVAGVAAVWSGLSLVFRSNCAWMAVVTALDAALLLRLAAVPAGPARAGWAIAITLATVAVAWYLVSAAQIGLLMGFRPADAVWKISPGLAWLYGTTNFGWVDAAWLLGALGIAWRFGR